MNFLHWCMRLSSDLIDKMQPHDEITLVTKKALFIYLFIHLFDRYTMKRNLMGYIGFCSGQPVRAIRMKNSDDDSLNELHRLHATGCQ
jgi:hypothetical protein